MGNAMAFVDMGDQFIAFSRGRTQPPDLHRHFGLVVDDKEAVRDALVEAGVPVPAQPGLDVRDHWGNQLQIIDYREVQFTKTPEILRAMVFDLEELDEDRGDPPSDGLSG